MPNTALIAPQKRARGSKLWPHLGSGRSGDLKIIQELVLLRFLSLVNISRLRIESLSDAVIVRIHTVCTRCCVAVKLGTEQGENQE